MSLHPHNIAQKTEIMVEHFQTMTRHKIGGCAKAMVVAGSRLDAIRYKQAFDEYIVRKGYPIKTMIACSSTVQDQDDDRSEVVSAEEQMKGDADSDHHIVIVSDTYQTGFDQPLLHTMYVDRRLSGIQAVQTLSRLNRTHPLKEDAFVLDFVNDPDEIREAFKDYDEGTVMNENVDPARLYEIASDLNASGIYLSGEIEQFSAVYFKPKQRLSAQDRQSMNAALDPAVSRFSALLRDKEEEAELFRSKVQAFRNLYTFLSQIIPYQDSDLERLYVFLRHVAAKLPLRRYGPLCQFDDEVRLEYYRLQKISEGSISLKEGAAQPLDGPAEVGSGQARDDAAPFSQLIDLINERFGTNFTQDDQIFFDQIVEMAVQDDALRRAAAENDENKFALVFREQIERLFVDRMNQNEEIFVRSISDKAFRDDVSARMASRVYQRLRTEQAPAGSATNRKPTNIARRRR